MKLFLLLIPIVGIQCISYWFTGTKTYYQPQYENTTYRFVPPSLILSID